jgi:hypothetical protein
MSKEPYGFAKGCLAVPAIIIFGSILSGILRTGSSDSSTTSSAPTPAPALRPSSEYVLKTPEATPGPSLWPTPDPWSDPRYANLLKPQTELQKAEAKANAEEKAREEVDSQPYVSPEYPIIIPHGYRRKLMFSGQQMFVWTGGRSWHWAVYPEQWKQFSNGRGYQANGGK